MAKPKEGKKPVQKQNFSGECDLDNGYVSPVKSYHDLTLKNVTSLIRSSRYVQILIALTTIGFFLRFYHLGYNSLWLDEASTYAISSQSFVEIWQTMAAGEISPPLFYWAEHIILTFGNSEAVLRGIPALFGVLTIPVFYLVGKEFYDRNAGILAAACCTFSPFLIYYSQEARAYAMALFFIAVAMLFFFKAQKSGSVTHWVFFGIFAALAFWTHFFTFIILSALILYAVAQNFSRIQSEFGNFKKFVIGTSVFLLLSLPLIFIAFQLFATRKASAYSFGLRGGDLISGVFTQTSGFNDIVAVLLVSLFIVGIAQLCFSNKDKGVFLIWLTAYSCAAAYIISFMIPLEVRHLIWFSIVFFVGIACSYTAFCTLLRHPAVVYGFITLLCIVSAPVLVNYYSDYSKSDWRGFSGLLQEKTSPGDIVAVVPGYLAQSLDYYYSPQYDGTQEYPAGGVQDLEKIYSQKGNSTIYFVVTADISPADPDGEMIAWLSNHTKYIDQHSVIYIFQST